MANLIQDLRFFIGAFFTLVGGILVFQGFAHPQEISGWNINFTAGAVFVVFGIGALIAGWLATRDGQQIRPTE